MKSRIIKKIFLFLIFYILVIINAGYPQSNWTWQNPIPQGNDYEKVKFLNSETGYAVGWAKAIVKTTNGGANWILVNNGILNDTVKCIHIFDSENVIIGGSSIYRTTNGGENWTFLSTTNVKNIFFVNINTGFAVDNSNIRKTTDGGANWTTQIIPQTNWKDLYFISDQVGFLTGSSQSPSAGIIYKTTNQGINWSPVFSTTYDINLSGIDFVNNTTGFVAGRLSVIKTTNIGQNWFIHDSLNLGQATEYRIDFLSNDSGYISSASSSNIIFRTSNGGISWDLLSPSGLFSSFNFINYNTGFIVGQGGVIYKTTNTGNNWICQSSQFGNLGTLNYVNFPNENTGYIFSGNKMLKTTNQGNSWNLSSIGNNSYLSSCFLNADSFYIGCGYNVILRTTNGGNNWDSLVIPPGTIFVGNLYFKNFNTGYSTVYQKLYKTTNSGNNWTEIYQSPTWGLSATGPLSLNFVNDSTGFFYTINNMPGPFPYFYTTVYKTTNGGTLWNQVAGFNNLNIYEPSSMKFISAETGFLSSNKNSSILRTTNGGFNWHPVLNVLSNTVDVLPPSTVYIPGYKSTNLGNTWFSQEMVFQNPLRATSMQFIDDNTGFMVGTNGAIVKTTTGGGVISSVFNLNQSLPEDFTLHQNYPNPFNPSTKISYDLKNSSFVALKIFDIIGREITTLVSQSQKSGSYVVDFKSGEFNLASGIYFYVLRTNNFSQTKKMLLIK